MTTPDSAAGKDNPDDFFLNTERNPGPGYLMLHRSGCPHFTRSKLNWTRDYIKFCAPGRASLENWPAVWDRSANAAPASASPQRGANGAL